MVRLVLFLFAILIFPLILKGQVVVDPVNFVLTGNPAQTDIPYHIQVTNTTNETINIFWSKRMSNQPAQWSSWICDKTTCYIPEINSCPPSKPNILAPGESFDLQVHMSPGGVEGTGDYELNVIDNLGNTITTVLGSMVISNATAVKETNDPKLTVYPNPTTDFFEVTETAGLKSIEVFNIIGNKVRTFDSGPQKQYYVGDLSDGVYLVRLVSSSKKVLKTIRLSKR